MTTPTIEPTEIRAGDTITWKKTLADYPAPTNVLSYRLINGAHTVDITAAADGTDHLVTITAATSAAYTAGDYEWFSFATAGTVRTTLGRGTITILPDPATAIDFRSHAKKVLDAIEAAIEGRATRTDLEYSIAGRSIRSMTHAELITARAFYKNEYQRELSAEKVKQGLGTGRRVLTRFV